MEFTVSERMKSLKGSAIREMFKAMADPTMISLAGGNPSAELFPNEELSQIAADILKENPVGALQYGISEGNIALREKILEMMKEREKINASIDEITIVSGGQQAIEIVSKILLNEGDSVIVEAPSFVGGLNAFRSYGANLVGVEVESDGINIEKLKKTIENTPNVKLIYTIPNFQNPSGVTMSVEKRKALYEIARDNDIFIIEDNPYGELTFDGVKLPTIKSMDEAGVVLYSGSFSKILAPGLRLGYLIAPKNFTEKVVLGKQVSDVHTALLPQLLALEFMKRYDIGELIEKMRALYKKKCDVLIGAMKEYLPENITYTVPGGGLFVWCNAPGIDTLKLSNECIKEKVLIVPGNNFATDQSLVNNGFRLNFSTMPDDKLVEGVKRLGKVLEKYC
ncbi:MAG: PLP-dependent aminotransferase family protein [Clostridia bacterium]|nr:PLP-dependent aminotransferase family protein [Clostridia bacterium]